VPDKLLHRIRDNQVSEGIFTVYLGLSLPGERLAEYMKIPHVGILDERGEADIDETDDASFFEKAECTLYSPSLVNPAHAPEGTSSLMLQTWVPKGWMKNWGDGDRKAYQRLKEGAKASMIGKASSLIPDLQRYIEFEDAATPLTYERYTHNTNGATSAWSWNPKNRFHKRMYGTFVDTPVKNLLIGSCWASQIGGVPGALEAALQCAKRIG
jgi:phytoene dehydrogenase-like protein